MDFHRECFLSLIRCGVGLSDSNVKQPINWRKIEEIAEMQGLTAIILDSIELMPLSLRPHQELLLRWIGGTIHEESVNEAQKEASIRLALLYHHNSIRTYVLKGRVVAECYPRPSHRSSADFDCFLVSDDDCYCDVWSLGNSLIESMGIEVDYIHYKNSTFHIDGLTVENHKYCTPFRGNSILKKLEKNLQSMLREDKREDCFEGSWLYRPPILFSALFLIEHAYSHFLHEGLTWRHILDWMMFSRKHQTEILWADFDALIDEYGFGKFYKSYLKLGKFLLGEIDETELNKTDKRMLADVWAPLDLHDSVRGLKGKLALVGNTWRARWKYHYFGDISMLRALWIQVKGFLFEKNPSLN